MSGGFLRVANKVGSDGYFEYTNATNASNMGNV